MGALGPAGKEAGGALAQLVGDKDPTVRAAARQGGARDRAGRGRSRQGAAGVVRRRQPGRQDRDRHDRRRRRCGRRRCARRSPTPTRACGARRPSMPAGSGRRTWRRSSVRSAIATRRCAWRRCAGWSAPRRRRRWRRRRGSPDPDVRPAALEAIGEVGGPVAEKTLEAALADGSERVRVAAVRGLGRMGKDAAGLLTRALGDSSRDVREAAVAGLGVAWADLPTEQLVARLGDETDADVRYAAALALARQADGPHGTAAQQALNDVADNGHAGGAADGARGAGVRRARRRHGRLPAHPARRRVAAVLRVAQRLQQLGRKSSRSLMSVPKRERLRARIASPSGSGLGRPRRPRRRRCRCAWPPAGTAAAWRRRWPRRSVTASRNACMGTSSRCQRTSGRKDLRRRGT